MKKISELQRVVLGVSFLLFAFAPLFGQPLKNMEKVGEINGLKRAFGIALSPGGEYAYIPDKGEKNPVVWVVNIANPTNPYIASAIAIPNPQDKVPEAWDVKVLGNHLYVAAYECGVWVYDITKPQYPDVVASYIGEKD